MFDVITKFMVDKVVSKFTKDIGDEGGLVGKAIEAGYRTFTDKDKMIDTTAGLLTRPVDLSGSTATTYAMSSAKAPDTPEVADYDAIEQKWTNIILRLSR